jgi:dolichol-phosphate mannosyltransferase
MDGCELTIILPAYCEADALRNLLPVLAASAGRLTSDFEIVVVDACTPMDETQQVCTQHGVRHVFRGSGNSYGDAVRTGIRESRGRFVIIMDADGSHSPQDLARLWSPRHEWDVVIGSRYATGGHTKVHAGLTLMSLLVNAAYRLTLGLHIRDMSNSFRLYRGNQLRSLELESTHFEIVEEILIALSWGPAQARILEVPITFEKRKTGESKRNHLAFALSYIRSIRRLRRFRTAVQVEKRLSPADHAPE